MADDKWILEKWADDYDRFHRQNMEFFKEGMELFYKNNVPELEKDTVGRVAAGVLGANSKFTYAFLELSGALVGSVVDLLRIGEFVRKPSIGSFVSDGLRIVVVGGTVVKIARFAALKAAFRVPGGLNSCTPTGMTMALRMSGANMRARISDIVAAEIGSIFSSELVLSPGFTGSWIKPWLPRLREMGLKISELSGSGEVKSIIATVKKTGRPVLFNAGRSAATGNNVQVPLHTMLAYQDSKGIVRIADQAGKEHLAEAYLAIYDTLYEVYQIEYAALLHPAVGVAAAGVFRAETASRLPVWTELLGVPVTVVDQNYMDQINRGVRERLDQMKPPVRLPVPPAAASAGQKPRLLTKAGLEELSFGRVGNSDQPASTAGITYQYKAKPGDTLFGLAKRYYGDAAKYIWIQKANVNYLGKIAPQQQLPVNVEIVIPGN